MISTPHEVLHASKLISTVLWKRATLSNVNRAEMIHDLLPTIMALGDDVKRGAFEAVRDYLRLKLEREADEAIAQLEIMGVRNTGDWPERES